MSASTQPKTRINLRSKSFWLICLFILYSLFGWVLVPMILDAQLKSFLKSSAKWDTDIERILFNPYALSLEISGAEIVEDSDSPVLNFERVYINFNLLKTLSGTVSFDEITLENPQIHVDLDQQGSTNFQRAFASESPEEQNQVEPSTEDADEPLALFFDLIAISEGAVYFTDHSSGTPHKLVLTPLSLSLQEFSTHHNQGGEYALSISLGQEQSIKWQGQIGIAPFQSHGHLILSNIDSSTFWHYVKDASPYWLNQASVSVAGDYHIESLPEGLQVLIEQAELQVDDMALSEAEAGEQWLSLKQLKLAPIRFDLQAATLDLGRISLQEPVLKIQRAEDQTLNILRPLAVSEASAEEESGQEAAPETTAEADTSAEAETTTETPTQAETSEPAPVFTWQLNEIRLNNGTVHWQDQALSSPAQLNIGQLALEIGAMSQDLSRAFPFDIRFTLTQTASQQDAPTPRINHIKGELSPNPFTLKGQANIPGIDLTLLQNYVSEVTNLGLETGRFSLQADYDLKLDEKLSGSLTSSLRIDQLTLTDNLLNKPLSGFEALEVGPVKISLAELKNQSMRVQIDQITLDQLYSDIVISEEGEMNLAHLAKNSTQEPLTPAYDATEEAQEKDVQPEAAAIDFSLNSFSLNKAKLNYTDASLSPAFSTQVSELSGTIQGISSSPSAKSSVDLSGKLGAHGNISVKGTLNPLSNTPNSHILVKVENVDLTMASPYAARYAGYLIDKGKLKLDLDYLIDGSKIKARNEVILNQFEFGKSVKSKHATSLPLPLAIGILKDRNGVIDLDLPISGDLNDPSFQIGSVLINTFVNIITKVVTSPFSILGGLIEGGDKLSEVSFQANASELEPEQRQSVLKLSEALQERPKLSLEIRGVADANIDRLNGQPRPEAELLNLAKQRAQTLSQLVIEQGNIDSQRVFIQEPRIIPLKQTDTQSASKSTSTPAELNKPESVTAKFTLGIR